MRVHRQAQNPKPENSYMNAKEPAVDKDGWFRTGDVATLSPDGYMQITVSDLIKKVYSI